MKTEGIFITTVILLLSILIIFYLFRVFIKFRRERVGSEKRDVSEVGFVVDTFHELVSKLKEKERELEVLRKKAEERAGIIEGYNENILQSVPSGVISFDKDMKITKLNSAAEKILDLRAVETCGKYYADVLANPITDMLKEEKTIERGEILYTTQTGKRIWLGLTLSPLMDMEKKTIGQILIFTDLTELKALEAQAELRKRLSSLGEMSAGIAHELRNPMGVIAGYTKLLARKVDDSLRPAVDAISKEVDVMDRIITDFLSFARPTELNISSVSLNDIIRSCVTSIVGNNDNIDVTLDINRGVSISGDEILLRQAFTNLIQNAVEAMKGGGKLSFAYAGEGDYVEISVSDTGHGIPESIKDKIFLPFYTTKEKGTGLGLAIAHKIIVSHRGSILVDSNEKGTTFRIRLPM